MAFTTPQAILQGIADLIVAQAPTAVDAGAGHEFKAQSEAVDWEDAADSDKDRRFTVDALTRDVPTMIGTRAEIDYTGTFNITIMHAVTDDENEGTARRDADLHQISMALEKKLNWATHLAGVFLVRYNSQSIRSPTKDFWQSILQFRINYTLQAI